MLRLQNFRDKGYRVHDAGFESHWAWKLIQKRFYDKYRNTKYFINVYLSDMRLWDCYYKMGKVIKPRSFCVKIHLYKNDYTFYITIAHDKEWSSLEEIEEIVEEIYSKMNMDLDHHNQ